MHLKLRKSSQLWILIIQASLLSSMFLGCSTPTPEKKRTKEEVIQRDSLIGEKLAQAFEPQMRFRENAEVTIHLTKVARLLMASVPAIYEEGPKIRIIDRPQSKWFSFALPGNKIYLSLEVLKKLEYENEAAALIAVQFGHIINKNLLQNLEKNSILVSKESLYFETADTQFLEQSITKINYIELTQGFKFSEAEEIEALKSAVFILYKGGFDARGIISLYKRYLENSTFSPYDIETTNRLIAVARKEVALYTPLRNPYIRSEKFSNLRKRIQDL